MKIKVLIAIILTVVCFLSFVVFASATDGAEEYTAETENAVLSNEEEKTETRLAGDADGDGQITNSDVLAIFRYIYNSELYPLDISLIDVNLDGVINNSDVLGLFRYIYNPERYPVHIFGEWKTEIPADCNNDGTKVSTCLLCGKSKQGTIKGGHIYKEVVVPPTKEDHGYTDHVCTRCGDSYKDNYILSYGIFEYTVNEDGASCTITGLKKEIDITEFTIPAVIDGYDVTEIGDLVFSYCETIEKVIISNGVTTIGDQAFRSCYALESITLGSSAVNIGAGAFYDCISLKSVYISDLNAWLNSSYSDCSSNPCSNGADLYLNGELLTTVTISGLNSIGQYKFYGCTSVNRVNIMGRSTSIDDYAFYGFPSLERVTLSGTVTTIGYSAFYDCTSLKNINFPVSVTSIGSGAFFNCTSLESITIGDGVTSIGFGAFGFCTSLKSITISASVTELGANLFEICTALENITVDVNNPLYSSIDGNLYCENNTVLVQYAVGKQDKIFEIPEGVTTICNLAFLKCASIESVIIPESMVYIGNSAFERCTALKSINIPGSVKEIGPGSFMWCSSLESVTIGEGVSVIADGAFQDCTSLKSIIIPDSVTDIGVFVFEDCTSLESATIGAGVTYINDMFNGCTSLKSIFIPENVINVGNDPFLGCNSLENITVDANNTNYTSIDGSLYNKDATRLIKYAVGKTDTSFVVPDSVIYISANAFENCTSLKNVTIGANVINIGMSAFSNCTSLESVIIGDSVEYIGERTFLNCTSLESIMIGDGVKYIDEFAFENCTSLKSITIPAGVYDIFDGVFLGCTSLENITVDVNNTNYTSVDGNLYNKKQTQLIQYAVGKTDTSFTVPDSVTTIKSYAFYGCSSLESVLIGDGVEYIREKVFRGCSSLKNITVDVKNIKYSSVDGNLYDKHQTLLIQYAVGKTDTSFTVPEGVKRLGRYAFENCISLKNVTLCKSLEEILPNAFSGCTSLESITIPEGVRDIYTCAFENCVSLKNVVIPSSVAHIDYEAFVGCISLESITVDVNNTRYASVDGNLYTKNKTELIQYAIGKTETSFVIPDGVKDITYAAFTNCTLLESVIIPDSVFGIRSGAFNNCTALESITIGGAGLLYFEEGVFRGCTSLKDVYYMGTEAQWNSVDISLGNTELMKATIHFTES